MVHRTTQAIIIVGSLFVLIACQAEASNTPTAVPERTETPPPDQVLTLGDVSGDPAQTIERFQPLADYLAARLSNFGIKQGKVIVTSDLEAMMKALETGQVDLYFDSPYPALAVYEEIGARPLLRRWKGGASEYHTLIVAGRDGEAYDLDDLLGKTLAFDHPASTSGYLLPKAYLATRGYKVTEKSTTESAVDDDEIGYVFAFGDENVLAWVVQGKTAGAAVPSGDYENLEADVKEQLTVLAQTRDVPRHIALARPGMEETLQATIVTLLLNLHQEPEGPSTLEAFEHTSRFDPLPQGPEGTMEMLQEMFAPVR